MKETTWTYVAANPSDTVASQGCAFGGFSESAPIAVHRLEPPVACAVVILCCGEPMTVQRALGPGSSSRLYAFSAALQTGAQRVTHSGVNDCVEIRLPPLAAYALLGGAIAEPHGEAVDLTGVMRRPIDGLLDRLRTAGSWQHRLASVDEFLARGLSQSTERIPVQLTWAWETLERSHGQVSVAALARTVGWSERHLISRFKTYFGVSPKATARRLRFSNAINLMSARPAEDLSLIAAHAGFSDQSHMTREFQTFSGLTPGALRTARFEHLPGIPAAVLQNS